MAHINATTKGATLSTGGKVVPTENSMVKEKSFRKLNITELNVDPSYQREVKPGHKKILAKFDEAALGIPLIGMREDENGKRSYWIVDGLQRISAMLLKGWKEVRCEVFRSDGPEHEAHVFNLVNGGRTRLTPGELFHALLVAGDEVAHKVRDTVVANGYTILRVKGIGPNRGNVRPGEVGCVKTLWHVVRFHGTEPLAFALRVIKAAWYENPNGTRDAIIAGLAKWYAAKKDKDQPVNEEKFIKQCQLVTPDKLLYSASQGVGSIHSNMLEVIQRVSQRKLARL
jgi:hypothetical protein